MLLCYSPHVEMLCQNICRSQEDMLCPDPILPITAIIPCLAPLGTLALLAIAPDETSMEAKVYVHLVYCH